MNLQIDHLPTYLQQWFGDLKLEPLKLFTATRAVELLIKGYIRNTLCMKYEYLGYTLLSETGRVKFGVKKYTDLHILPETMTINEIQRFAEITDENIVKQLLSWITQASVFWKDIIPGFEVLNTKLDSEGLFVVSLKIKKVE